MSVTNLFSDTPEQLRLELASVDGAAIPARTLDFHREVKWALSQDVKAARWSRLQIADGLSLLVNRQVTEAMLDAMMAESKEHRFPAEWIPAWCRITGSRRLLDLLCSAAGYWLADRTEHELAELAKIQLQRSKAAARIDELRKKLLNQV